MSLPEHLPTFDELPIKSDAPPHSAWGVFGDDDQIGTLNLLTPERVAAAARLVQRGEVFALNWALELPDPPLFARAALRHTINKRRHNVFDDVYDNFNTQSSSQWDGLTHFGHREYGFYNGVTAEQITGATGTRNGIEHWARRGIAGRGVLVDYAHYAAAHSIEFKPGERAPITAAQIQAAADWQGLRFEIGDILLLRTGWIEWYNALNLEERTALAQPGAFSACGIEQSEDSLRFLWDNHFAAIAGDQPAFEAYPPLPHADGKPGEMLHSTIIGLWGMPIGEMFTLDALAAACVADGRYEVFFTSAPLNKRGGVASPPNALALK
ncbi:MAG: cyclase family protein [Acidobacteria bacterium]|nr:cyclase family protein [Acidobacteriota bacterium]MBI3421752.1 cyclase family protein [Acidobacteriota bacterium]